MQVAGEGGLLVCFTIVVRVFENDQLVGRFRVADTVMRVTRHGRDPESTLIIECHLDRVGEILELFLRGEQLDFVAVSGADFALGRFTGLILKFTVLKSRIVVGFNGGEFERRSICGSKIHFCALEGEPDRLITQGGHLPRLLILVAVVLRRSVRPAAAAIDLHAIGHFVIIEPAPVFLVHRSMN